MVSGCCMAVNAGKRPSSTRVSGGRAGGGRARAAWRACRRGGERGVAAVAKRKGKARVGFAVEVPSYGEELRWDVRPSQDSDMRMLG
jgi:hypothetical protein